MTNILPIRARSSQQSSRPVTGLFFYLPRARQEVRIGELKSAGFSVDLICALTGFGPNRVRSIAEWRS